MIPNELLILQDGQQVGPFPADAVKEMLRAGTLSPQDFAWGEGLPEWVTLGSLFPIPVTPPAPAVAVGVGGDGPRSYASFVLDAFSYPFRGDGAIILISGTLFFAVLGGLGRLPVAGLVGRILSVMLWGYLLLMLQSVVHGTAQGEQTLPSWPKFEGRGELIEKWLQWLVTIAFCFGPAFLVATFGAKEDGPDWRVVSALALVGAVYFPMAMLAVAMFDTLAALNPLVVVRAIVAAPLHYLLTLIVFAGLAALKVVTGRLEAAIPYVGGVIDQFDALWSAVFLARILGGLYYVNRNKFNWF